MGVKLFDSLDSVQRAAYKDLIALLDNGSLLSDKEKKGKCEDSFRDDELLACSEKTNGTHFTGIFMMFFVINYKFEAISHSL